MARLFSNGDSSELRCTVSSAANHAAGFTCAGIGRYSAGGGSYRSLLTQFTSGLASRVQLTYNGSGIWEPYFAGSGSVNGTSATQVTSAEGWVLTAISKAVGTTAPRYHRYRYDTNAHAHEDAGGTVADSAAPGTDGSIWIGSYSGDASVNWRGEILVVAFWARVLTDAEIEALPFSLATWYASAPVAGWLLDQAAVAQNVIDWTGGGANQSALVGTAIATVHPPVFSRGAGIWAASPLVSAAAFVPFPRREMSGGMQELAGGIGR